MLPCGSGNRLKMNALLFAETSAARCNALLPRPRQTRARIQRRLKAGTTWSAGDVAASLPNNASMNPSFFNKWSIFLSTSRGRAEMGNRRVENLMTRHAQPVSCSPVMHRSYAGRSHNASTRLRKGLLRLHSGTPNIRQSTLSSLLSLLSFYFLYSFTIDFLFVLIPWISNDLILFK